MLFLFNDRVIEVETPEARLMSRWREIGCGDPAQLRAHEAVDFAKTRFQRLQQTPTVRLEEDLKDLAALIVAKTGANSLILRPTAAGDLEPHLRDVPVIVLETYRCGAANDQDQRIRA